MFDRLYTTPKHSDSSKKSSENELKKAKILNNPNNEDSGSKLRTRSSMMDEQEQERLRTIKKLRNLVKK